MAWVGQVKPIRTAVEQPWAKRRPQSSKKRRKKEPPGRGAPKNSFGKESLTWRGGAKQTDLQIHKTRGTMPILALSSSPQVASSVRTVTNDLLDMLWFLFLSFPAPPPPPPPRPKPASRVQCAHFFPHRLSDVLLIQSICTHLHMCVLVARRCDWRDLGQSSWGGIDRAFLAVCSLHAL